MTKQDLKSLINDGAKWAQVEQFVTQEIEAAKAGEIQALKAESASELKKATNELTLARAVLSESKKVIADEDLEHDETYQKLNQLIDEAEKPADQRELEAAERVANEAIAKRDALREKLSK